MILERVAQLQERDGDVGDARGMTAAELEQVVGELGISKQLVKRAASEVAARNVGDGGGWLVAGKTDAVFEQTVHGSIDEAKLTQMLQVLRRRLGERGKLEVEGGARIWSTESGSSRKIDFTLVEHEGTTTLRLEDRMSVQAYSTVGVGAFAGWFFGILFVIPLKALLVKSALLLMILPSMFVGAVVGGLVGRALWKRHSTARQAELNEAFEEVLALAESKP